MFVLMQSGLIALAAWLGGWWVQTFTPAYSLIAVRGGVRTYRRLLAAQLAQCLACLLIVNLALAAAIGTLTTGGAIALTVTTTLGLTPHLLPDNGWNTPAAFVLMLVLRVASGLL
ncbi:hypothetical protein [Lacticaseibacillus suihuaensis]